MSVSYSYNLCSHRSLLSPLQQWLISRWTLTTAGLKVVNRSCKNRGYSVRLQMFQSWNSHFIMKSNSFSYETVLRKMLGTQLRICRWAVPIASLSLYCADPPSSQSFVLRKLMKTVAFSANCVTTSSNAASWHIDSLRITLISLKRIVILIASIQCTVHMQTSDPP